jgi:hypothetical protein
MTSATDEQWVEQLASEVDAARDNLDELVTRLNRKRHAIGGMLPFVLVVVAIAAFAAMGASVWPARLRSI